MRVLTRLEGRVPPEFTARLSSFAGEKLKFDGTDPRLPDEASAKKVVDEVSNAAWTVSSVESSERRNVPQCLCVYGSAVLIPDVQRNPLLRRFRPLIQIQPAEGVLLVR